MNNKIKLVQLVSGMVIFAAGIALSVFYAGFLPFIVYLTAFAVLGCDVVMRSIKNIARGNIFDENFLMSIATTGAFCTGEYAEAAAVMLFYQIGEMLQEAAVDKSKRSITKLMDIRPDYANLKNGENIEIVAPDTVSPGDIIIIKPGEKIPLDGIVEDGFSTLDTSALTGESAPRYVKINGTVLSGFINVSGVLTVKVTKTAGESTASKIIDLVENAYSKKAKAEKFISVFARFYTPVVVFIALALAAIPPLFFSGVFDIWLKRAFVFLVISCPCALVLSVPLSFFAGIGSAAKSGILVKGGNFLEALNHLDIAVFDKTGTLTKGVFKVTNIIPANGISRDELLEMVSGAECYSNHPIALSVMREYGKEIKNKDVTDYTEYTGMGVSVKVRGTSVLAGNKKLMESKGIQIDELNVTGTTVYAALDNRYAGCIIISDEIRTGGKNAISTLKNMGVRKTFILSGDNKDAARAVGAELGIDEVYGELLAHEKVDKLNEIIRQKNAKKKIAFIGDGINDAPSLAIADVGIAMAGRDAAIEAADIVLMNDDLGKLIDGIKIARFTDKIVKENIIFILAIKVLFLVLGAFGIAAMWEAVFADVGVSVLAVLNSMRILKPSALSR
ncbi:MAG: cadmium-translocating P-type ATPase [Treponema sp.]|jgi:Cd2+/Zn2+-exporting ATPase|nr:cadmium-translocating P-type ATPase [Treponema sp.]